MGTQDFSGAITKVNPEAFIIDTNTLYKKFIEDNISRRVFPTFLPILKNHEKTFRIDKVFDDLKTNYGMKAVNFPTNHHTMQPLQFDVPKIYTKIMFDKDDIAEMDASKLTTNERIQRMIAKVGEDEDLYSIAGESTENGVTSFSDTTNFSTAASTQLDLTSLSTLKTTAKTMISQLRAGLKTSKIGIKNLKQAPLGMLVTEDVKERLTEMGPTDGVNELAVSDGFDYLLNLLAKYGASAFVEESPHLGATVSRDGLAFKKATDGSTNAVLLSAHPWHYGVATSPLRQTPALQPNGDLEYEIDERLVPYSVVKEAMIYSATVDITA